MPARWDGWNINGDCECAWVDWVWRGVGVGVGVGVGAQVLVLDEADRLMDLGFQDTVDAIVKQLPRKRRSGKPGGMQTMLFSATQTKKVGGPANPPSPPSPPIPSQPTP